MNSIQEELNRVNEAIKKQEESIASHKATLFTMNALLKFDYKKKQALEEAIKATKQ